MATPFLPSPHVEMVNGTVDRRRPRSAALRQIHKSDQVNFRQTGDGTSATCPVALSLPVFLSRRKMTMLSDF